jgi:hypothetical protein
MDMSKNVWQIFSKFPPIMKATVVSNISKAPIINIRATALEKRYIHIALKINSVQSNENPSKYCYLIII